VAKSDKIGRFGLLYVKQYTKPAADFRLHLRVMVTAEKDNEEPAPRVVNGHAQGW